MLGTREQTTKRAILHFLKVSGEAEAKAIAKHCGLTTMAVSRHLLTLRADRLIDSRLERRPRGRPARIYGLTKLGDGQFPREYRCLVQDLLTSLQLLEGDDKVSQVFRKRRERMTAQYKERFQNKGLEERVQEATAVLTECGYMAEAAPCGDRAFVLTEHNCAIRGVAECFPAACSEELRFLQGLVKADVKRVSHLLAGDCNCSYLITEGNASADSGAAGDKRRQTAAKAGVPRRRAKRSPTVQGAKQR